MVNNKTAKLLFDKTDNDVYFLAWTTTPWTLPSNTALAVGEKIEYLLDNEKSAQKMGKAGKKRIELEFSIQKMINSYYS